MVTWKSSDQIIFGPNRGNWPRKQDLAGFNNSRAKICLIRFGGWNPISRKILGLPGLFTQMYMWFLVEIKAMLSKPNSVCWYLHLEWILHGTLFCGWSPLFSLRNTDFPFEFYIFVLEQRINCVNSFDGLSFYHGY